MLVSARGLIKLDKSRWEERWKEVMGHSGKSPTCKILPAWEGANGVGSYMAEGFNLDDGSEIWFRGVVPPLASAKQA